MPLPASDLYPGADVFPGDVKTAITLDPAAVATNRTELLLNDGAIRVAPPGPDWGEAAIAAYMADLAVGSAPVDYRLPNRQIKIPLVLGADGPANFEARRSSLQAKVALFQREGGWLGRGDGLYLDIVNATLTMPDQWGHLGLESDVVLVLEALPDFYGDETTLDPQSSSSGELVFTETGILGDHPGRLRIILTEQSGNDQLGLLYGIRCRHYDPASTAALVYFADHLTPLDLAAAGVNGGEFTMNHNNLAAAWTPVLSTDVTNPAVAALTHTGSYRVWARVYSSSATPPALRFLWDVGDFTAPTENDAYTIPAASNWYLADLGEIRIDPAPTGTHRWRGVIQAKGALGGEQVSIHKLYLQPVDEAAGRVVATIDPSQGLAASAARDEFNQTAGSLAGKTLPVGGTWSGAGDADDFTIDATNHNAQRTATVDVDINTGRYEIAGTGTLSGTVVQVDTQYHDNMAQGIFARYVDTSNWVMAHLDTTIAGSGTNIYLRVRKRVAGTVSELGRVLVPAYSLTYVSLRFLVGSSGTWFLWYSKPGSQPILVASGYDAALAAGGALASGKVGIYEANPGGTATARPYDNFAAWAATPDAALYASRHAELRWDGTIREATDTSAYGPTPPPIGDLPRIPVSGEEGRTVELFLKPTRGDFDQLPDTADGDPITEQLAYRPCWLFRQPNA